MFGDGQGGAQDAAKTSGLGDELVGGQHGHQGIRAGFAQQVNGGQANGGGCIAADGLGQDMRGRDFRRLAADGGGLFAVGHDPEIGGFEQGRETGNGLLQHRFASDNVEQLLGLARAAARPEAGAAASGEDDGMSKCICGPGRQSEITSAAEAA